MAQLLPPLFGGRASSIFSQGRTNKNNQQPYLGCDQPMGTLLPVDAVPRTDSDSRSIATAMLWLGLFAAAQWLFNQPQLMPVMPGTELRLLSVPMALFGLALMLRPSSEAPLYCLIYLVGGLWPQLGTPDFQFALARIAI